MDDTIYRQAAIGGDGMNDEKFMSEIIAEICNYAVKNGMEPNDTLNTIAHNILAMLEICTFNNWKATDAVYKCTDIFAGDMPVMVVKADAYEALAQLPSAQPTVHPQRTCVNCGRTMNNGGWYADGRTRCPIEEHYALPKDGYCHLWEKRNVTDDDYPERREE